MAPLCATFEIVEERVFCEAWHRVCVMLEKHGVQM
jgi:hypothetical protein